MSILKTTELCALGELYAVWIISLYWAVFNKLYKLLKEYIGSEFGVHESSCTTRPIVYMKLFPKGPHWNRWNNWVIHMIQMWFSALEKEMATHSSVLAWRIPGMGEPGGLPSMGSHRVGPDWSDLAAAAAATHLPKLFSVLKCQMSLMQSYRELVCNTLTFLTHALIRLIQVQWGQSFLP